MTKRVAYYLRKSREYSDMRRSWKHRFNRLMAYKAALNKKIEKEREVSV